MQLHHDWDQARFISAGPRTPTMYSNYLRSQLDKSNVLVLPAEVGGAVAGYVYAGLEGQGYMALRGPAGVVYDIYVDEEYPRQGLGRALLVAAVDGLGRLQAPQVVCPPPIAMRRVTVCSPLWASRRRWSR